MQLNLLSKQLELTLLELNSTIQILYDCKNELNNSGLTVLRYLQDLDHILNTGRSVLDSALLETTEYIITSKCLATTRIS